MQDSTKRELWQEPPSGTLILERFRLGPQIATGGSSRVYLGTDELETETRVAIKILHEDLLESDEMRARFLREAGHAARAVHPRLCRLIASGWFDGAPVLVAEWLEGVLLSNRIESGPLPVLEALSVADGVLDGLLALHNVGLVHRDIKPNNIMLMGGRCSEVKVLDFGSACFDRARAHLRQSITPLGRAMGTLGYASPEQSRGGPVDSAADVYSLGVVLSEMLTGDVFNAEQAASRLQHLDAGLQEVVRRALQRNPSDRFGSAAEMQMAMKNLRFS